VQVVELLEAIEEGAQSMIRAEVPGTWSVTAVVGLWLPSVAVTTADGVVELVSVPVVAENVALLCPDNTVTLELTLSAALLLCSETDVLEGADSFRETVHVDVALDPSVEGVHETVVSATGGSSVKLAVFVVPLPAVKTGV
jgi:hypothetical protein